MVKKKMVIGILGGIGSGKSTVARCFEPLGCAIIEADQLAHEVLLERDTKEGIICLFGAKVLGANGQVDRTSLAKVVFEDLAALERLNALLHPKVIARMDELIGVYQGAAAVKAIVLDVPLLAEVGRLECCDVLVFVDTDDKNRLQRLKKSGRFDENELKKREKFQISLDKKRQIAHYTISNNSDLSDVAGQVARLFSILTGGRTSV